MNLTWRDPFVKEHKIKNRVKGIPGAKLNYWDGIMCIEKVSIGENIWDTREVEEVNTRLSEVWFGSYSIECWLALT
jgi:hypothetical protein